MAFLYDGTQWFLGLGSTVIVMIVLILLGLISVSGGKKPSAVASPPVLVWPGYSWLLT